MKHYDKILKEMEQIGFKKENDMFIFDNVTYNTMIVNGQQYQQPQHNYLYLQYICEGYIKDASEGEESDTDENLIEISEFDFLNENKEPVTTICASDINDIKFFLGL